MLKAIYYKEWIKTRVYIPIALLVSLLLTGYAILRIARVSNLRGIEHLWEILLSREVVFIETLRYLPLVLGVVLAIVQFVPEMMGNRLKLTLHLPYPRRKMTAQMTGYGAMVLLGLFIVQYAMLWPYLSSILAPELTSRILLTSLPWYVCGLNAYFLAAWICLEPTWTRRLVYALMTAAIVRIYFLSPAPQAYDGFIAVLLVFTLCCGVLPHISVHRFREGKQD